MESLLKSRPSPGESKGKLCGVGPRSAWCATLPHRVHKSTRTTGTLVANRNTDPETLGLSAHKHLGKTCRVETVATNQELLPLSNMFKKSDHALAVGAGSGGRNGQHALHLHHQWWKGSTQRKEGFHLQSHTSDLESQQVDHVNESRVRQCSKRQEAEFNKGTTRGRLLTGHFAHDIAKKTCAQPCDGSMCPTVAN